MIARLIGYHALAGKRRALDDTCTMQEMWACSRRWGFLVANDTCERCGTPIYGWKAQNPTAMAGLGVITLIGAVILGMPRNYLLFSCALAAFLVINAILRRKRTFKASHSQCEICGRRMEKIESGHGYVMVSVNEQMAGIGSAEECRECGRLYCDQCYPSRPSNSCVCGQGRNRIHTEGGTIFRGSVRLVKVRYVE